MAEGQEIVTVGGHVQGTWKQTVIRAALVLLLVMATALVYHGVLQSDFISMDDPVYVTHNPYVNQGFSKEGVRWAFDFGHQSGPYWLPLTMMSHMLDCQFFGLNPSMHHLHNLILHLMNVVLVFLFFMKISGDFGKSLFIAALFALHPLNVESVAWVTSRKNVLSTLFWLLAMLAYARYVKKPGMMAYGAVFGLFALGLMAKASVITLMCSLLLLDIWPFHRFLVFREEGGNVLRIKTLKNLQPLLEKLPFLIFTGLVLYVNFSKASFVSEATTMEAVPLALRLSNAFTAYGVYVFQVFFPVNLSVYYPYPATIPWWMLLASLVFFLGMAGASLALFREKPWLFVGWFWFVGNLVMVSGLIQGGTWPAHADRFMYVPSLGVFVLMAWGMAGKLERKILVPLAALFVLALGALSWGQVKYWKDSITLYRHALLVHDNDRASLVNLAFALDKDGKYDEALTCYRRILEWYPDYAEVHSNLGALLAAQGNSGEALEHLNRAVAIKPDLTEAWLNAGKIYERRLDSENAINCYEKVMEQQPGNMAVLTSLCKLLVDLGRLDRAVYWYESSLMVIPQAQVSLSYNLACVYSLKKDEETALHYLAKAIQGGFRQWAFIDKDPQLVYLRSRPGYAELRKDNP